MRILVTGSRGKVGSATVDRAARRRARGDGDRPRRRPSSSAPPRTRPRTGRPTSPRPGDAYAVVYGHDAVIHAAAIPDPSHHPPATVFENNLMATFNTLEAAVRLGVPRFVHVSSETVPGFFFAERPWVAEYAPIDEEHPARPQDPYALAKHFGEQLMDAADPALGHPRDLDPPVVGPVGGQLRAQPRPVPARPRRGQRELLELHRRLRPRRRPPPGRRERPPRPRDDVHRLARQLREPPARGDDPPPSRRRRRDPRPARPRGRRRARRSDARASGCSATPPPAPGATT